MPLQDENVDTQQLIVEYATIFWRRKIWFVVPLMAGIALSMALILFLPKWYRATTLILVEEQKIPEEFVHSTVSEPIEGRLSTIRQQLLSRFYLQQMIDRFGLYKNDRGTAEEKVDLVRKAIDIKTMGELHLNAFSISFVDKDPMTTMNVTNELASLLIKENLKIREQRVEGTTEFIDSESQNLKKLLEQQEGAISQFKQKYSGELPGQTDASLRTLDRLQLALQQTQTAIKAAEEVDPLIKTWIDEREKLAALRRQYKDSHPDVIAFKKEIRALEEQILARDNVEAASKREQVANDSLLPLKLQKGFSNASKRVELKLRQKRIEDQIADFERRVENGPQREQEFAILSRDYENTRKNYQMLLDKKLTAKISENLEKRQKGEQFLILDPATLPEKPYTPNPVKMTAFGIVFGLVGGILIVLSREMADSSIYKPEELEKLSSVPVLASILDYKNFPRKLPKITGSKEKTDILAYMENPNVKK